LRPASLPGSPPCRHFLLELRLSSCPQTRPPLFWPAPPLHTSPLPANCPIFFRRMDLPPLPSPNTLDGLDYPVPFFFPPAVAPLSSSFGGRLFASTGIPGAVVRPDVGFFFFLAPLPKSRLPLLGTLTVLFSLPLGLSLLFQVLRLLSLRCFFFPPSFRGGKDPSFLFDAGRWPPSFRMWISAPCP